MFFWPLSCMQALKIQPQTFKSSYIKLIALVCSHLYSLIFVAIIAILNKYQQDAKLFPSIGLAILIILGFVYLITAIVYIVVRNVSKDCKCLKAVWLVDIAYLVGGLFYYVGKNIFILANICRCETVWYP